MNRKELIDCVKFRLSLREWAMTQPGYKSPVTEADVEEVMAKIRPLLKTKQELSDQDELKYDMLVQIIKNESPKPKLPISMEVKVMNFTEEQKALLNQKLVEIDAGEIKATELGRRFTAEFKNVKKK